MSRRFWASMMFLAALLTAGSAYFLMNRLSQEEPAPQPVPLRQVPASEAPAMPAIQPSTAAVAVPPAPAVDGGKPANAAGDTAPAPDNAGPKRNILFKLARPSAKKVEILGDFTSWVRKPMKKSGKIWQYTAPLAPGSYEYVFVVDDKKVRDPNNKKSGSNGKTSVLTVKPLGKHP